MRQAETVGAIIKSSLSNLVRGVSVLSFSIDQEQKSND
jgi:hypothetical protein